MGISRKRKRKRRRRKKNRGARGGGGGGARGGEGGGGWRFQRVKYKVQSKMKHYAVFIWISAELRVYAMYTPKNGDERLRMFKNRASSDLILMMRATMKKRPMTVEHVEITRIWVRLGFNAPAQSSCNYIAPLQPSYQLVERPHVAVRDQIELFCYNSCSLCSRI